MCPHKSWADNCEVAEQKASNKLANQMKSDGQSTCLMSNKLGYPTKKCPMYKEARKEAQIATRRCYGCNELDHKVFIYVHTSKASIEQTKAAYAMLVEEMGI